MWRSKPLKLLAVFMAIMAVLTLISRGADSLTIAHASVESAKRGSLMHEVRVPGTVEALNHNIVWSVENLRITGVHTEAGDSVEAGTALVTLSKGDVEQALSDAQKALAQALADRDKAREDKDTPREQVKLIQTANELDVTRKQAKVDELQTLLDDSCAVRAPVSGVVTSISAKAGELTSTQAIAEIADTTQGFLLKCSVTRTEAKYISVGDTAYVTPPGKRDSEQIEITSMSTPNADDRVQVTLQLPGEGFTLGGSAEVRFASKTDSYDTCISLNAVRSESDGDYVLVVRESNGVLGNVQVAEKVRVQVIDKDASRAAVEGALFNTDYVIVSSDKAIEAGDRIRLNES